VADPRANTFGDMPELECTSLWSAAHQGQYFTILIILASGRGVDTQRKSMGGSEDWNNTSPAEIARSNFLHPLFHDADTIQKRNVYGTLIADLIDSINEDPLTMRQRLRELPELRGFVPSFLLLLFT
jgi:hypothetical protein